MTAITATLRLTGRNSEVLCQQEQLPHWVLSVHVVIVIIIVRQSIDDGGGACLVSEVLVLCEWQCRGLYHVPHQLVPLTTTRRFTAPAAHKGIVRSHGTHGTPRYWQDRWHTTKARSGHTAQDQGTARTHGTQPRDSRDARHTKAESVHMAHHGTVSTHGTPRHSQYTRHIKAQTGHTAHKGTVSTHGTPRQSGHAAQ